MSCRWPSNVDLKQALRFATNGSPYQAFKQTFSPKQKSKKSRQSRFVCLSYQMKQRQVGIRDNMLTKQPTCTLFISYKEVLKIFFYIKSRSAKLLQNAENFVKVNIFAYDIKSKRDTGWCKTIFFSSSQLVLNISDTERFCKRFVIYYRKAELGPKTT